MAAALLPNGASTYKNVPLLQDVSTMAKLLRRLGCTVEGTRTMTIAPPRPTKKRTTYEAPYDLVKTMRASVLVLGPLVARYGHGRVSLPGGCAIGARPIDQHLKGLTAMGAKVVLEHGYVDVTCRRLRGATIVCDVPTVTGCENLMMAAALAKGRTVIENAAREPEVVDLASFLTRMGATISGAGTSTIHVEGVDELVPVEHTIVGDRVEAGTLLMACGAAGGAIELDGIRLEHLEALVRKLVEVGMDIRPTPDGLSARADRRLVAADVQTLPFPGIATDFMPPMVALLATAEGTSIVTENVFDNRFAFVDELNRMGADVRTEGRHAIVRGRERLSGAPVRAFDVRAGAALVLAALSADGPTTVHDPHHVERGYANLPAKLRTLGADVERLDD
jgi:UDP-N-acetylglucosamine 1-carboxyvinyltransferase